MPTARPPARRCGRGLRALVITLVVLAALLVGADRVGLYIAERAAGDTIQSSQHLGSRPSVDIAGFPFLTQLAAGKSDEITVSAKDVPVGQDPHVLAISQVRVVLHRVSASRDFSSFHADTAEATALVSYAELGHTLGIDIHYAGDGRIKASKQITVLGQSVQAGISAQPRLVNGALAFGATSINGLGELGGGVSSVLNKVFALNIPLHGIPFDIRVQSLRVDARGVQLALTGSNLSYSK